MTDKFLQYYMEGKVTAAEGQRLLEREAEMKKELFRLSAGLVSNSKVFAALDYIPADEPIIVFTKPSLN